MSMLVDFPVDVQNGTGPNGSSSGPKDSRSNPEQMDTLSTPIMAGTIRTHGPTET